VDRSREILDLQSQLQGVGYIAEPPLVAALLLMLDLGRPLLLEGDAGVGKTEVAKAVAAVRGARLIRLQCYEGLDVHAAICTNGTTSGNCWPSSCSSTTTARPPSRNRTSSRSAIC
jgi:hypothetical protein